MASVLNKPTDMDENSGSNLTSMKLSDCNCSICMYILIEPVTMPCGHEMCMSCFKKNVQKSSLNCPMCRVRISSWARRAAKNNTLINQLRWRAIQEAFPLKVSNRLNGKEDDSSSDEETEVWVNIAKPGEIREEYEKELERLENERQKQEQAELEASAKLLNELGAEEIQAAKRRELELQEQMAADEMLARKLQSDMEEPEPMNDSTADVLRMLEERCRSNNSSRSSHSQSGTRMMDKFLAKGKRQMQTQQRSNSPYPYVCASPSEKNKDNEQSEHYQSAEDKVLAESLIEIFGRPVSDTPKTSPAEEVPITEEPKASSSVDTFLVPSVKPTATVTPSTSSKVAKKEITLPPDKPPDVVVSCIEDSITQELVHFRPIHACPKTPPRRLPGGRLVEHKIIRSTPINQAKIVQSKNRDEEEEEMNNMESQPGMQSPVMQKRLKELATERRFQVAAQSKSTLTETGGPSNTLDENFWLTNEEKLRNTVKYAAASGAVPSNVLTAANPSGKISIQSLFKKKVAAATVASSSANDAHLLPTDELPDLPDLNSITVISDDDDDDDMEVVKAILPLESNVDEDFLQDAEPLGLSDLSKLMSNSGMFDESLCTSECSQSSDQLYIADGGQSDKDSKSVAAKIISELGKILPSEPDLTCESSSKAQDWSSQESSTNLRPQSDIPSLTTSELLSSASRSSSSMQSSENGMNNVKRVEVNLKVIDESARMEIGDSNSLLYTNLMQMSKPSEGGYNRSSPKVTHVPVGPSPSELKISSSRSPNEKEQFTSIKEWFKKWSAPSASSKDDKIDGGAAKEDEKVGENSSKSPLESTIVNDAASDSNTATKPFGDAENSLLESSTSRQRDNTEDHTINSLTSVPQHASVSCDLNDSQVASEVTGDRDLNEKPADVNEQNSVKPKTIDTKNVSNTAEKTSQQPSPVKGNDAEANNSKTSPIQPQIKRSTRRKKINERFTRDYVVESPITTHNDSLTKDERRASETQLAVENIKRDLFHKGESNASRDVKSNTSVDVAMKNCAVVTPRKRKQSSNGDSCGKEQSPTKKLKKATLQKRTPAKRVTRTQCNEEENKTSEQPPAKNLKKSKVAMKAQDMLSSSVEMRPGKREDCENNARDNQKDLKDSVNKSPKKLDSGANSRPRRTPRKALCTPEKSEINLAKSVKNLTKVTSPRKNSLRGVVVLRSVRNSVIQSPKRKISEVEQPTISHKKMLKRDSSCIAESDEGCGDKDATLLYDPDETVMYDDESPSSTIRMPEDNAVKSTPAKGKTSKLVRTKKNCVKTKIYKEILDKDRINEADARKVSEKSATVRTGCSKGFAVDEKDTRTNRTRCQETEKSEKVSSHVRKSRRGKGTTSQISEECPSQPNAETKVGEDKENEVDEVFLETNVTRSSRANAKAKVKSDVSRTPPRKTGEFMMEYSPRSGGKKVVINRMPRKRAAAQRQLKLSCRGTLDTADDDDDFTVEPVKRRRAGPSRKSDKSDSKQMTLHDLFGKPKPETSGEKPSQSGARDIRARKSPRKAKKTPEKMKQTVCAQDDEDDDESVSDMVEEPRTRTDFDTDEDYKAYLEDRDLQMAMQLQAEYEFEAKYKLNCVRRKGSQNSYSFRRK